MSTINQVKTIANKLLKDINGGQELTVNNTNDLIDIGKKLKDADLQNQFIKEGLEYVTTKIREEDNFEKPMLPEVTMSTQYGINTQEVLVDVGDFEDNMTYKIENGQSIDPFIVTMPKVQAKFYDTKNTYELPITKTRKQFEAAFSDMESMDAFWGAIDQCVRNKLEVSNMGLILACTANMIGETYVAEGIDGSTTKSGNHTGPKVVNLRKLYNDATGENLTANQFMQNMEAKLSAVEEINNVVDRLQMPSKLYNIQGVSRFTPKSRIKVALLSQFSNNIKATLYSKLYNKSDATLPEHTKVLYWQNPKTYNFKDVSSIHVNVQDPDNAQTTHEVVESNIIGIAYDERALEIINEDLRATGEYNGRGEYYNNWFKFEAGYRNKLYENFVVFTISDDVA